MPWQLTIVPESDRSLMKELATKALSAGHPETVDLFWTAPYGTNRLGPITHRVSCGWHPDEVDESLKDPKKVVTHLKKDKDSKNISEAAAAAMLARCRNVTLDEQTDPVAYLTSLGLIPVGGT